MPCSKLGFDGSQWLEKYIFDSLPGGGPAGQHILQVCPNVGEDQMQHNDEIKIMKITDKKYGSEMFTFITGIILLLRHKYE